MPNSINIALCQSNTNRLMVLANENVAILLSSSLNKSEPAQVEPLPVSERFGSRMISSSKSTLHEALWCPKTLRLSNWESLKFFGIQTLYFDSIELKHSIQNPTPRSIALRKPPNVRQKPQAIKQRPSARIDQNVFAEKFLLRKALWKKIENEHKKFWRCRRSPREVQLKKINKVNKSE